jgi:hypothetical protein
MDDGNDNDGLRTRPDKMRRRHVPVIVWLAVGSLLVSGCVPQFLGTKKGGDADLPKGISVPENNKTAALGGENRDEERKKEDSATKPRNVSGEPASDGASREPEDAASLDGRPKADVLSDQAGKAEKKGDVPPRAADSDSSDEATKTGEVSEFDADRPAPGMGRFRKHDHAKYLEKIKSTALEIVAKDRRISFAGLCRNQMNGDWNLRIYHKNEEFYSFKTFSWNAIEEKWEDAVDSEKRKAKTWHEHLRFYFSKRDCEVLKEEPASRTDRIPR